MSFTLEVFNSTEKNKDLINLLNKEFDREYTYINMNGIEVYDIDRGSYIDYHFENEINFDKIFEFGELLKYIEKDKFYSILSKLDRRMFNTINKVYFLSNDEEINKYNNPDREFTLDIRRVFAMYSYNYNIAAINIIKLVKFVEDSLLINRHDKEFNSVFNYQIFISLIHELRHAMYYNNIINKNNELSNEEDVVERFAKDEFYNKIEIHNYDYKCIKLPL